MCKDRLSGQGGGRKATLQIDVSSALGQTVVALLCVVPADVRKRGRVERGSVDGFFNFGRNDNEPFIDTMNRTDRFLASLGYLQGGLP